MSTLQGTDMFPVRRGTTTHKVAWSDMTPAAATEAVKGIVELATTGETTTGTDATRAVTPKGLKAELDRKIASAATAPTSPKAGDLWFNTNDGRLYIYYTGAAGSQWVDTAAGAGAGGTTLNFPASPTVNDTYTQNGATYTWNGTAWTVDLNAKFVNVSGDTMTGNLTVPSLNGGQLAGFRNQIINGDFAISQRGTSFTQVAAGAIAYSLDRWCMGGNPANTLTITQFDITAGLPFSKVVQFQCADNTAWLGQPIELPAGGKPGPFKNGSTWTLSVWSNVALANPYILWSAGSATTTDTQVATGAWVSTGQTEAGYTRYSYTFTVSSAPSAAQTALRIQIHCNSGATYFTGVQLEAGTVATPFERRPIGVEFLLCQRYHYKTYTYLDPPGKPGVAATNRMRSTTSYAVETINFPTYMRVAPACVVYNPNTGAQGSVRNVDGNTDHAANISTPLETGVSVETSAAAHNATHIFHLTADAEL